MEQEKLVEYLQLRLDKKSWKKMAALVEVIEHGWGKVSFTFKNGQIVGYRIEKTG
ncbi:hypothetical protein J7L13_02925 [bacterium]|nr:hypothetical protein [bacterium]